MIYVIVRRLSAAEITNICIWGALNKVCEKSENRVARTVRVVQLLNKHKIHEYLRIELDPIASCALDKCNYPRLSWRDRGWEFWSAMKHLFLAISRFLRSIRRIRIVCRVHVNQSTNESTVFGACRKVCVAETASIDYPFVRERYSVSRGLKTLPQERGIRGTG